MIVDADLVQLRRVDVVEPVSHIAKLDGVAVLDDGVRCRARGRPQQHGQ